MKNKISTAIILTVTFILAGVAIFTAIRLYQLRNQSVSPTSPESKPAAAGQACGGIAGTLCPANEVCVFSNGTTKSTIPDDQGVCAPASSVGRNSTTQNSACNLSFTISTATPTPTPTPTITPSPTPVPQCNSNCSTDSNCTNGLTCYKPNGQSSGQCRNSSCVTSSTCTCTTSTPTPTPTPTIAPTPTPTVPASCGGTCTSNSNCQGSMICYEGSCRNPSCVGESDCLCQTSTTEPTQPSLPNSGTEWPTLVGAGLGILVILGSLLLAL